MNDQESYHFLNFYYLFLRKLKLKKLNKFIIFNVKFSQLHDRIQTNECLKNIKGYRHYIYN